MEHNRTYPMALPEPSSNGDRMKLSNRYYYDLGKKAWNAEAVRWLKDGCTWTESVTQANRLVGKNRQDLIKVGKTQSKETE